MTDLKEIHEEIRRIREDTDSSRGVRESLQGIEAGLSGMTAADSSPDPDEIEEIRAEIARLADNADGQTAVELDRLREQVRDYELEDERSRDPTNET